MSSLIWTIFVAIVTATLVHAKCNAGFKFSRHYNEALVGHLIKTIPANHMECTSACGKTLGCRSVNMYKNSDEVEMCDLSDSSRTTRPDSMAAKPGYEYDELTTINGCSSQDCLGSTLLTAGWQRFNSSLFQLFKDRVTWSRARKICKAHGGDLVSIASQQEKDFISTKLLPSAPRGNSTNTRLMGLWLLDGSDTEVTLHGDASVQNVNGYKALHLDGTRTNYATTPQVKLSNRGFSIGAWIKLLKPATTGVIYADWSSPYKFAVQVDDKGKVFFLLNLVSTTVSVNSSVSFNVWAHVIASWGANNHEASIYINGELQAKTIVGNFSDTKLVFTSHKVYDIGLKRNQSTVFHGYIRELAIYSWPIVVQSRAKERMGRLDTFDGVWTGLNDLATEGTFSNSDGSAVTYSNWDTIEPNNRYDTQDCAAIFLGNATNSWWDQTCGMELPFICEKKDP